MTHTVLRPSRTPIYIAVLSLVSSIEVTDTLSVGITQSLTRALDVTAHPSHTGLVTHTLAIHIGPIVAGNVAVFSNPVWVTQTVTSTTVSSAYKQLKNFCIEEFLIFFG